MLKGYLKMFDDDQDARNIRLHLTSSYEKYDYEAWRKKLVEQDNFESIRALFSLYELEIRDRSELVNRMEVFSLLENVFRNTILLPYIPAYRSINLYSGRYQSFVHPIETTVPFKKLQFQYHSPNLLMYTGTNQSETMFCAHACAYLRQQLKKELDRYDNKMKQ